jgi:hypothetical protein
MHPIIAVCALLVLAGAVMALRWGHLDVVPPWTVDDDEDVSVPDRLGRVLWYAGVFTYAAVISGLTVLGPGGRLVMRLLAANSGDDAQGRVTEAEEIVGAITVDGTIGFIIFVGLFGGVVLAGLYLLLRKWLPPRRWGALTVALLFGVVSSTRLEPLRPDNPDFTLVGPSWLAVTSFLALGALTTLTMGAVAGRTSRWLPLLEARPLAILPYAVLVVVAPAVSVVLPAVVGTAVGLVLLRRADFRRLWSHPRVLLAGRVLIVLVVLAFLPAFIGDVADILG